MQVSFNRYQLSCVSVIWLIQVRSDMSLLSCVSVVWLIQVRYEVYQLSSWCKLDQACVNYRAYISCPADITHFSVFLPLLIHHLELSTMVNTPIPHSLKSEAKKAAKILREFTMPNAKAGPDKLIPGKPSQAFCCFKNVCVHACFCCCCPSRCRFLCVHLYSWHPFVCLWSRSL